MSETSLYRKYRPKKFKEVLGQDHVVRVLESSIEAGNISHAYIFSGSRGTGKTSVARIFADAIGTSRNDISEIDAASNNGVDEIRALNEAVNSMPFDSKYKVYILDEVHMFSKSAWNALLKTLEEPPKHVIFILATTEFDKIPDTVVSRCQNFSFKKPSHKSLKELVISTAKKEGYTLDQSSADLIAVLGDGSFRDMHSILQKVISASKDRKISPEEVEMVVGAPRSEYVNDFIKSIANRDAELGLSAISKAVKANVDMQLYFKLILHKMRAVLMLRNFKEYKDMVDNDFSDTDLALLQSIAGESKSNINSDMLLQLLTYTEMLKFAYLPELVLELALLKIIGQNVEVK